MARKLLGYTRPMGYTQNSSDIRRVRHIKTASSMFMTKEERESLQSAMDFRALGLEARRERDKFARQDAAVEKFHRNYFKARENLAAKINKNRAIMELRHELQRARWRRQDPHRQEPSTEETKPPISRGGFNEVELKY
ncbi:MAG: hypothetical protein FJ005_07835 [Chloroflexi bacterium]|nr:hypothetical protein [Chloroflexota bacterium]